MVLQHRSFFHDQRAIDIDTAIVTARHLHTIAIHCNVIQNQRRAAFHGDHRAHKVAAAQQRAAARDADVAAFDCDWRIQNDRSGDGDRVRLAFHTAGQGRGAGDGRSIRPAVAFRRQRHRRQQTDQHRQTKRQRQHAPAPFCRLILLHHFRNSFALVSVLHT